MFSTSYYSTFSNDIIFVVEIFLLVIVPFLVVIFIDFWLVIFSTYYSFGSKGSKQRKADKPFSSDTSDVSR